MANILEYTGIAERQFDDAHLSALHQAVRITDGTWRAARAQKADPDLLRDLVQNYVDASHTFQKARYGKIKVRLSASVLLRLSI